MPPQDMPLSFNFKVKMEVLPNSISECIEYGSYSVLLKDTKQKIGWFFNSVFIVLSVRIDG